MTSGVTPHTPQPWHADAAELDDMFENAPCGYVCADPRGKILRANHTLSGWLGVDPGALAGKFFAEVLSFGSRLYYETHVAPMLRMKGAVSEVLLELLSPNLGRLPIIVSATERHDDAGEVKTIRIAVFTAPERRRYERDLIDARTDAEDARATAEHALASAEDAVVAERTVAELREQLIAILGHDLRNPVAAIGSGLRILKRETLSERGNMVIGLMDGSVVRMSVLINNVLDFARERLGGSVPLSLDHETPLAPVIEQVAAELRMIAPEREIVIDIDCPDPAPIDHGRLGQIVSNLLSNALTHGASDRPVRLTAKCGGDAFELSVTNGGEPIGEEALAQLFRPFYRGEVEPGRPASQGLGLGLYIASELAKAHGGLLDVSSTAAETRFTFRMPFAKDRSPG